MNTSITPATNATLNKKDYIAFDAMTLRNLIIERLNNEGVYTDQNYIGSNLASIIDIISYSFNTLMFYLNKTSTESMFTEAQLYENINRIVKLIDYKPVGYQTSTLAFQASATNFVSIGTYTIPRYSYITVGSSSYSFNEDVAFSVSSNSTVSELEDLANTKLLFQGTYREAPVYTAVGEENEVITLNISNLLVDHFNIDVYVYEVDQEKWIQYQNVSNLYTSRSTSRVFERRLNSTFSYEFTFGNGINGRKLKQGDKVAIYYLQSSGEAGVVGPNALAGNPGLTLYTTPTYRAIKQDIENLQTNYLSVNSFRNLLFDNAAGSTLPQLAETPDSIRKNAPANFKAQYRLVTKDDFESYIQTNFSNIVSNVKILNNWDYVSVYLKYFKNLNISPVGFKQLALNQVTYADACNFNNVYICAVPRTSKNAPLKYLLPAQKELILSNIQDLKPLTTEIVFVDPIYKALSFGSQTTEGEIAILERENYVLNIVKSAYTKKSDKSLINEAETVLINYFNQFKNLIGEVFDHSSLVTQLLGIDGVADLQIKNISTNEITTGLSFFMWNPTYPDIDKKIITNNATLNLCEFMYFENLAGVSQKIIIS